MTTGICTRCNRNVKLNNTTLNVCYTCSNYGKCSCCGRHGYIGYTARTCRTCYKVLYPAKAGAFDTTPNPWISNFIATDRKSQQLIAKFRRGKRS